MASTESQTEQGPVRILVQTATHLVPGDGFFGKCKFLQDTICQLHWNCDFDPRRYRWITHGANFAFANRRCYFVLDYGQTTGDDDVPILFYEWTGEALNPKPELAESSKIRRTLQKEYPFGKPLPKPQKDRRPMREFIQVLLHQDIPLSPTDFEYIRDHAEDAAWLRDRLEPGLWVKIEQGLRDLEEREKAIAEGRLVVGEILPYREDKGKR